MVFTETNNNNFFTNGPQMGLTAEHPRRLENEGLGSVDDFIDFKEDQIEKDIKNLKTAIPTVPAIPQKLDDYDYVVVASVQGIPGIPPCFDPC